MGDFGARIDGFAAAFPIILDWLRCRVVMAQERRAGRHRGTMADMGATPGRPPRQEPT